MRNLFNGHSLSGYFDEVGKLIVFSPMGFIKEPRLLTPCLPPSLANLDKTSSLRYYGVVGWLLG